jgi:hypothetical protein
MVATVLAVTRLYEYWRKVVVRNGEQPFHRKRDTYYLKRWHHWKQGKH